MCFMLESLLWTLLFYITIGLLLFHHIFTYEEWNALLVFELQSSFGYFNSSRDLFLALISRCCLKESNKLRGCFYFRPSRKVHVNISKCEGWTTYLKVFKYLYWVRLCFVRTHRRLRIWVLSYSTNIETLFNP